MRTPMLLVLSCAVACTTTSSAPSTMPAPAEIRLSSTSAGAAPDAGAVTRTTVYQSSHTVTQVLRLAPQSKIGEHHHPSYDETFAVEQGRIALTLDGKSYDLGAGEFIVMPAGTTISGVNPGAEEARVLVAFSDTGVGGPFSVPGASHR